MNTWNNNNKQVAGSVALADVLIGFYKQGLERNLRKTPQVAKV